MIEHDCLQIYRLLCDCWWDLARRVGQCRLHRHNQDSSYDDLGFFLPDALGVDVISMSQSSRAEDMTWLEAVEVAGMEPVEAAELLAQTPKLQSVGRDMETKVALIVQELGHPTLTITLAASYVAATPRL